MGKLKDEIGEGKLKESFPRCPFCKEDSLEKFFGIRKSHLLCHSCGAKWSLHYRMAELAGVALVITNRDGLGKELLQREFEPKYWLKMASTKVNVSTEENHKMTIREIVKEKEVIVKIRCAYCHKLYDETANTCPHCGASR